MNIYQRAIEHYGTEAQIDMFIGECAELVADIQRHKQGRLKLEDLAEECADVKIVTRQLTLRAQRIRPLTYAARPVTLDAARFVLLGAAQDITRGSSEFLSALLKASRATDFIASLAGPENVEDWIKIKTDRLGHRIDADEVNKSTDQMVDTQDCYNSPRPSHGREEV